MIRRKNRTDGRLLDWVPRHVVPDELSLLSLYEIVAYILITIICFHYYNAWHRIPVVEKDVYVERLNSYYDDGSYAIIDYSIPNSMVFKDTVGHIGLYYTSYPLDRHEIRPENLDSLAEVFYDRRPSLRSNHWKDFIYFGVERDTRYSSWEKLPKRQREFSVVTMKLDDSFAEKHYKNGQPVKIIHEVFVNTEDKCETSMDLYDRDLLLPRFFSPRDISQAYFIINVHSYSIDSIALRVRFQGVTEISPMGKVAPSYVSGDNVQFMFNHLNKPQEIDESDMVFYNREKGYRFFQNDSVGVTTVKFHAKYKDMENMQSRRVFLISAILSALITLFLAFTIIFVYKAIRLVFRRKDE